MSDETIAFYPALGVLKTVQREWPKRRHRKSAFRGQVAGYVTGAAQEFGPDSRSLTCWADGAFMWRLLT